MHHALRQVSDFFQEQTLPNSNDFHCVFLSFHQWCHSPSLFDVDPYTYWGIFCGLFSQTVVTFRWLSRDTH